MAARTAKGDLKTPAAQRLIDVSVSAGAIDHEQGADGVAPWRGGKEMPHAAQIAFAFFTHIADEKDVCCRFELRSFQRIGDGQKRGDSRRIVTDSGTIELIGFFTRLQRGALGEDGIQDAR